MAYQAFDYLDSDLDILVRDFRALFDRYRNNPQRMLSLIEQNLNNAFVVFVSFEARELYDDGSFWEPLFSLLGLNDSNARTAFKRLYVNQLRRLRMTVYESNEKAYYYFYTALFHGGLSKDSWADLWKNTLLPFGRRSVAHGLGAPRQADALGLLNDLKHSTGSNLPGKVTLTVLEKTPDEAILPLLEMALSSAFQYEQARRFSSSSPAEDGVMLTSDLPVIAIRGLQKALTPPQARSRNSVHARRETAPVFLPKVEVSLNLQDATIRLAWKKTEVPPSYKGCRFEYSISGRLLATALVEPSSNGYRLPGVIFNVAPQDRLVIDVRMRRTTFDGEKESELVTLLQETVEHNKPGTLEFILDAHGRYVRRGRGERISRKKRVAYLIKKQFEIRPASGMSPIETHVPSGDCDYLVQVFDVAPGASGAIFNHSTELLVASWSEFYQCSFEKKYPIGQTDSSIDLYPCPQDQALCNTSLPTIVVAPSCPSTSLGSVKAELLVDGRRVSVLRKVITSNDDDAILRVEFRLGETLLPDSHANECHLAIYQSEADTHAIFTYRFAIAPIQKFRLSSVAWEYGRAIATYEFKVPHGTVIEDGLGKQTTVGAFLTYSHRTLLSDEIARLHLLTPGDGKQTDAVLGLAGIEIHPSDQLQKLIASDNPIGLPELLSLGRFASTITVTSKGRRSSRGLYVSAYQVPVLYRELQNPGVHQVSLLSDPGLFLPSANESERNGAINVTIRYGYSNFGRDESFFLTDCSLARTYTGYGVKSVHIVLDNSGSRLIAFGGPARCELDASFYCGDRRLGGSLRVKAGMERLPIPRDVSEKLGTRKNVYVILAPLSPFGKPKPELAETLLIER